MKIGFDVDGVLANFWPSYQDLFIKTTGRDTFLPSDLEDGPPSWNWPSDHRGYSLEEEKTVWSVIRSSPDFWTTLDAFDHNIGFLKTYIAELERYHEIYYITDRPGVNAKRQTKVWLRRRLYHFQPIDPTIIIGGQKGLIASVLSLDAYVDDKFENVRDVIERSPKTRTFYVRYPYNKGNEVEGAISINNLSTMLEEIKPKNACGIAHFGPCNVACGY